MKYIDINYSLTYEEFIKDKLYLEYLEKNILPKWCIYNDRIIWGVQLYNLYRYDSYRV